MADGNFEARVSAKRETSAGIFLTLQLQPDDYVADLATLRVGSSLVIGWSEVIDTSVQPIETNVAFEKPIASNATPAGPVTGIRSGTTAGETAHKDRRPFASLPLSQQAALRCQDDAFLLFLAVSDSEAAAKKVRTLCGVSSRSELNDLKNMGARETWFSILDDYDAFLTDRQYAEVRR